MIQIIAIAASLLACTVSAATTLVWNTENRGLRHAASEEMAKISDRYELHDFAKLQHHDSKLTLNVLGRDITLDLRPYDELFPVGYQFETWDEHGNRKLEGKLNCIYRATSKTHNGYVSFCDSGHARNLRAQLFDETLDSIIFAPLQSHRERALVAVYEHSSTTEILMDVKPMTAPPATDATQWNPDTKAMSASFVANSSGLMEFNANMASIDAFVNSKTKSIGCVFVIDNALYNLWGAENVHARVVAIAAAVASYYAEFAQPAYDAKYVINFQLSKIIAFGVRDPFNATKDDFDRVSGTSLLDKFGRWLQSSETQHDVAQLISGHGFMPIEGASGWAWVSTTCDRRGRFANGVTDGLHSDAMIAIIISHESAHSMGSEHDDTTVPSMQRNCASESGIMGRRLSEAKSPAHRDLLSWSTCTAKWLEKFFGGGDAYNTYWNPACAETPDVVFNYMNAVCGDGIVEENEECDDPSGTDKCCNSKTCKLTEGAVCSLLDGCCDSNTCQPRAAKLVCRKAKNSCDLEETCDGESTTCPEDLTHMVGTVYTSENSISGTCGCQGTLVPSSQQQCMRWNSIYYDVAPVSVENPNACGNLWCKSTQDLQLWTNGLKLMTGTTCGQGMGCLNDACVPFSQIHCSQPNPIETTTRRPTTRTPTAAPTASPARMPISQSPTTPRTSIALPTGYPMQRPTKVTEHPTRRPTRTPTTFPTRRPTRTPTTYPTRRMKAIVTIAPVGR